MHEAQKSCDIGDKATGAKDVPLGLGGGLQPTVSKYPFYSLERNDCLVD